MPELGWVDAQRFMEQCSKDYASTPKYGVAALEAAERDERECREAAEAFEREGAHGAAQRARLRARAARRRGEWLRARRRIEGIARGGGDG